VEPIVRSTNGLEGSLLMNNLDWPDVQLSPSLSFPELGNAMAHTILLFSDLSMPPFDVTPVEFGQGFT
jgi:hypothetical protein